MLQNTVRVKSFKVCAMSSLINYDFLVKWLRLQMLMLNVVVQQVYTSVLV